VPEQAELVELARAQYDEIVAAPVEQALEQLDGPFDTILCLDVLEHLVDPEQVMRRLLRVAASDARLQVSLPNARHVSLMKDLVFRGTFGYTDCDGAQRVGSPTCRIPSCKSPASSTA
jgi:2-polyprenyl-3-methyl-5-hydroxy-6-metoxy-1,4-benzoquinol methylase